MNRTLPGPAGDVALVLARLILATIMFAHGYQKLFIDGLGRTTRGFESMSIPVAIVSAAYVTVVELVGSVLVLAGALITVVAACYLIVMVGAAVFVHIPNGIFAADGGWELVGRDRGAPARAGRRGARPMERRPCRPYPPRLPPDPRSGPAVLCNVRANVRSAAAADDLGHRQPSSTPTMADVPAPHPVHRPAPVRRPRGRPPPGKPSVQRMARENRPGATGASRANVSDSATR